MLPTTEDAVRLQEQADEQLRKEAISNLTEKFKNGQKVGKYILKDLIECELGESRYAIFLANLEEMFLQYVSSERYAKAEEILDGMIERFLNDPSYQYLVEEEMAEIEAEPSVSEDYDVARIARHCGAV